MSDSSHNKSRRQFVKKAAYIPPAVLTLKALPAFASVGSGGRPRGNNGVGNGIDPQPPGNPPINDGPGTSPGNPGNAGGVASTATGNSSNTGGDAWRNYHRR